MTKEVKNYEYYEKIARENYGRQPSWSEVMEIKEEIESEDEEEIYTYGQMQMRAWGA